MSNVSLPLSVKKSLRVKALASSYKSAATASATATEVPPTNDSPYWFSEAGEAIVVSSRFSATSIPATSFVPAAVVSAS